VAPLLLLVLLVLFVRLPGMVPSVFDWDENLFMLSARALLQGQFPYVAVFDNKPLGGSMLIAAAMTVLRSSVLAVRLLGCLSVAATTLLLPRFVRLLKLPPTTGLAAAILRAAFSAQLYLGQATYTELLLAPFTVAALCVAAAGWYAPRGRPRTRGSLQYVGVFRFTPAASPPAAVNHEIPSSSAILAQYYG
jgi:hypothetical protein